MNRFDPATLIAQAQDAAGSDDFGDFGYGTSWQDGLGLLTDGLAHQARLSPLGVEIACGDIQRALVNRLQIVAHRTANRAVADGPITQPIVIVGQPRTGTTILYDLLAQDPGFRTPLTWEVDEPCPVPQPETYETDPRIAQVQASIEMSEHIVPGFLKHHPMDAQVGQECVRITAPEFTSMIYSVQYHVPSYEQWWLHEADQSGPYRFHRVFLQHLQSEHHADRWLLKSPAHLWSLPSLLAEYPDAIVIQNHRDPLKVIASISALGASLREMTTDNFDVRTLAAQYGDDIMVGLDRALQARADGLFAPGQVVDVRYQDFRHDPIATIAGIYDQIGLELTADTEARMGSFLAAHPGDQAGSLKRYSFADTGLDEDELRERARPYQEFFGVETEQLS